MPHCAYILPLRRIRFVSSEAAELRTYLETLTQAGCEVMVVDGSPPEVWSAHDAVFGLTSAHIKVDRCFAYLNDKVNAVHTGVAFTQQDKIILADDDIRYSPEAIAEIISLLDNYEVVRPQNFLRPQPIWSKMEAARMLINRATLRAADYPGTCAFRRDTMLAAGHYDGDVLFDNEEIIRNFAQNGCAILYATNLFVRRRPSTFRKWIEQRPRQAYEDFGLRTKTAFFLSLLPLLVVAAISFGALGVSTTLVIVSLLSIFIAWRGRARGCAHEFFPLHCCFFAPVWIAERTLSTYWALYWYFSRGGYPFGDRVLSKGIGRAWWSGARAASAQFRQAQK